jgi:dipeptidyl-peptidase III
MLLRLHIYRCTADNVGCREFYEDLSSVDDAALKWREIIVAKKYPPLAFTHANTYIDGGTVKIREYEPTARGIIQSWAER